ncbi:UNVERIFIED_ORG: hypothetical protein FHW05_000296 [Pantoea agglomerans]
MAREYINFNFNMSSEIQRETALEIVAVKQVLLSIIAKFPQETRAEILKDLKTVDNNVMRDIVRNVEIIP